MEIVVPFINAIIKSFESFSGVRYISDNKHEIIKFGSDASPFLVVFIGVVTCAEAVLNTDWLNFWEESSTWVALSHLATVPKLGVSCWHTCMHRFLIYLVFGCFGLIQTQNSGLLTFHELLKVTLLNHCINSIHIPHPNIYGPPRRELLINCTLTSFELRGYGWEKSLLVKHYQITI